jgi:fluoride exporter
VRALLTVALGGALGSVGRYALTELVTAVCGASFPWGTILVNVTGSALIGAFAAGLVSERVMSASLVRELLVIGLCGGYTTFSSFSLQTFALLQAGQPIRAAANVLLSVALCLAATYAGYGLVRAA